MGDKRDDAYNKLRLYLDKVRTEKSEHEVNRSRADNVLYPSKPAHFKSVKGFERYTKNVREQFNNWMVDTPDKTAHRIQAGESPVQPCLMPDRDLHAAMSNGIAHLDSKGGSRNEAPEAERLLFNCVHKYLQKEFKVSLLHAIEEVPLSGFAFTTDENFMPEFNLWSGKADAIGLLMLEEEHEYKYVIIDWKSTGSRLNAFWEHGDDNMRSAYYRDHLTQCLLYARLLKMHLSLNYWPPILIVPFNSDKEYIHPRLFTDYPDESKRAIEKYQWSPNPPLRFKKESPSKDKVKDVPELEGFAQDVPVQQPFLRPRQDWSIPLPAQPTVPQSQLNEEFIITYKEFKVEGLWKVVREAVMTYGKATVTALTFQWWSSHYNY